jgi:hypothetical protein
LILHPSAKHRARGLHLRAVLGLMDTIGRDGFDDRSLRNGWMHLDEDIEALAAERGGGIFDTAVVQRGERWYRYAESGSVRMVDPENLTVVLPRRGIWSLRPYFHRCRDLQHRVRVALEDPFRWECVDNVCGIAVRWGGRPEVWVIKSLSGGADIVAEAATYMEVRSAFRAAVEHWQRSRIRPDGT